MKSRSSLEVRNGWMSMYEDQALALARMAIEEARSEVSLLSTFEWSSSTWF